MNHLFQSHTIAIAHLLEEFFERHPENKIEFWKCPNVDRWSRHQSHDADKETKISLLPLFSSKTSWDFSRKEEADNIIGQWQMCHQASEFKGSQFFVLKDSNDADLVPTYTKGGTWLFNMLDIQVRFVLT